MSQALDLNIAPAFNCLFQPARYKIFWGGRAGGRSWHFAIALLVQGYQDSQRILCCRELQNSIAESVHKLLEQQINRLKLNKFYKVYKHGIEGKNGTEFIFEGLGSNPDRVKSLEGITRCWVEEADRITDRSWELLLPTIRDANSEIWASFNPNSRTDPVWQRFIENPPPEFVDDPRNPDGKRRYSFIRKVSWRDNPWFPEELKIEMRRMKKENYEDYLHIWEGELRTIASGAIYRKQILRAREEGRITNVPIQSGIPVHTFWDLGKTDYTSIWFMQKVGYEHHFVDYLYASGEEIEYYMKKLKERGYFYGTHHLPHDGKADRIGMRGSIKKQLENAGFAPVEVVPVTPNLRESIETARSRFSTCCFDQNRCAAGIEALSNYEWKYDEKKRDNVGVAHGWASHGADAFRQFTDGFFPKERVIPKTRILVY